jgi:hypothetical protein
MPTSYLIDRAGVVRLVPGFRQSDVETLRAHQDAGGGEEMRRVALCALALALSGCASWFEPDLPDYAEYTEEPKSYLEICLEHDFLLRVKPWERAARTDMA